MFNRTILSYPYLCLKQAWDHAPVDTMADEFVDKLLHGDVDSCLKRWSTSSMMYGKATDYAKRLAGLDGLLDVEKQCIFGELVTQINTAVGHRNPQRSEVNALTPEQCKIILLALHADEAVSKILNKKNFKAVNYYDSERAKGKIAALYDFMLDQNNGRPYHEDENSPGGLQEISPTDFRSTDDNLFDVFQPSLSVSPDSVCSSRCELVALSVGQSDPDPEIFLREGAKNGWFSNATVEAVKNDKTLPAAIRSMKVLAATDWSANLTTDWALQRAQRQRLDVARALFRRHFSEPVKMIAKEFLEKNVACEKLPRNYLQVIPTYLLEPASPAPSSDTGEPIYFPDLSSEQQVSPAQLIPVITSPLTASVYDSTYDSEYRLIIENVTAVVVLPVVESSTDITPSITGNLLPPVDTVTGVPSSAIEEVSQPVSAAQFQAAVESASDVAKNTVKKVINSLVPKEKVPGPIAMTEPEPTVRLVSVYEQHQGPKTWKVFQAKALAAGTKLSDGMAEGASKMGSTLKNGLTQTRSRMPEIADGMKGLLKSGLAVFKPKLSTSGIILPSDLERDKVEHDL